MDKVEPVEFERRVINHTEKGLDGVVFSFYIAGTGDSLTPESRSTFERVEQTDDFPGSVYNSVQRRAEESGLIGTNPASTTYSQHVAFFSPSGVDLVALKKDIDDELAAISSFYDLNLSSVLSYARIQEGRVVERCLPVDQGLGNLVPYDSKLVSLVTQLKRPRDRA